MNPHGEHYGHNLNVVHPCPQSPEFQEAAGVRIGGGLPESYSLIQIVSQKPVQNDQGKTELWTVAKCAYCSLRFRMSAEDLAQLAKFNEDRGDTIKELFRRAMAGYLDTDAHIVPVPATD